MYVILQLQHSVGDVSNSTSSTVQSLTELVVFFQFINIKLCQDRCSLQYSDPIKAFMMKEGCVCYGNSSVTKLMARLAI